MLAKDMLPFRKSLSDQGILFCYNGYITEDVLFSIGTTIKQKMASEGTDKKVARGLFSLFVEQMQNVIRYSAEKESGDYGAGEITLRYGLLVVGAEVNRHFVACSNMIEKKDEERLRTQLTEIQGMDAEGLKALFRKKLKEEVPEGSQGAGVGFIDIARRATQGFEFDFSAVDDAFSYFSIKAYI